MNYLQILLLQLVIFSVKSLQNVFRSPRILIGNLTEHKKFPFQVLIITKISTSQSLCGGSILDDYHVISAAHCFINKKSEKWKEGPSLVLAGVTDFSTDDRTKWLITSVKKVYIPKMYQNGLENNDNLKMGDIAVLKLNAPFNLTRNIHLRAVRLPRSKNLFYSNQTSVVNGYGVHQLKYVQNETTSVGKWKMTSDNKLRSAKTTLLRNSDCQKKWDSFTFPEKKINVSEKHVCAQIIQRDRSYPEGICLGDSGSPLIQFNNIIIGVVSYGPSSCEENKAPGIYTRISAFVNFIKKIQNYKDNFDDPEILSTELPIMPRTFFNV